MIEDVSRVVVEDHGLTARVRCGMAGQFGYHCVRGLNLVLRPDSVMQRMDLGGAARSKSVADDQVLGNSILLARGIP